VRREKTTILFLTYLIKKLIKYWMTHKVKMKIRRQGRPMVDANGDVRGKLLDAAAELYAELG
jgi:hypothetical protein